MTVQVEETIQLDATFTEVDPETGVSVAISLASIVSAEVEVYTPAGALESTPSSVVGDGSTGQVTAELVVDEVGEWRVQHRVELTGGRVLRTPVSVFIALPNLEDLYG